MGKINDPARRATFRRSQQPLRHVLRGNQHPMWFEFTNLVSQLLGAQCQFGNA
jgi:hypothetical protein